MALRTQINNGVDSAFRAVGDLVSKATLVSVTAGAYDFASRSVTAGTETTTTVDAIVTTEVSTRSTDADRLNPVTTALMKTTEVPDISIYDYVTIASVDYNIAEAADDGFLVTALLTRRS